MKTDTYPLAIPKPLLEEVRQTSKATGLSMADAKEWEAFEPAMTGMGGVS